MVQLLKLLTSKLHRLLVWLWQQEGTAGQRARGVAAGVFTGCFPLFGLQTLLGITLASVVRGNHLLAATGTWISNPSTYVPLYWFNYHVGSILLHKGPNTSDLSLNKSQALWNQGIDLTMRMLLGSTIVGLIAAGLTGGLTYLLLKKQTKGTRRPHLK